MGPKKNATTRPSAMRTRAEVCSLGTRPPVVRNSYTVTTPPKGLTACREISGSGITTPVSLRNLITARAATKTNIVHWTAARRAWIRLFFALMVIWHNAPFIHLLGLLCPLHDLAIACRGNRMDLSCGKNVFFVRTFLAENAEHPLPVNVCDAAFWGARRGNGGSRGRFPVCCLRRKQAPPAPRLTPAVVFRMLN